jgi:hypothetical protein
MSTLRVKEHCALWYWYILWAGSTKHVSRCKYHIKEHCSLWYIAVVGEDFDAVHITFLSLFVYDGVTFLSEYELRMFCRVVTSYHVWYSYWLLWLLACGIKTVAAIVTGCWRNIPLGMFDGVHGYRVVTSRYRELSYYVVLWAVIRTVFNRFVFCLRVSLIESG